nr:Nucleoside:H+ symporter:Major facilitator superfamily MFS_1 [uncultured bacterium]
MVAEMRGDLSWYGRLRLWGSVGFIVAVMLGGQVLERYGIVQLPLITCIVMLLVLYASTRLKEAPVDHHEQAVVSVASVLRKKEVIAFFSASCLMVMSHSALYVFYSLYLEKLGYSKSVIGTMWSIGVLAEIIFFFYQAPIFRRIGTRKLMLGSMLIAVLRFILIANVDGGSWGLLVLVIAQILHAATFGVHHSASVMQLQTWFGGNLQARGQALYTSISYGFGGTVGGILMGFCWESGGAHAVFLAAAAMAAIAWLMATFSYRWQQEKRA